MRPIVCIAAACTLAAATAALPALASSPVSVYTAPASVLLLPDDEAPTEVVLHGAFFFYEEAGTYTAPSCGYLHYRCKAGEESMCAMQWKELAAGVGGGSCLGFGQLQTLTAAKVQPAGTPLGTPATWDLGIGVTPGSWVDGKCDPAKALACAAGPCPANCDDANACTTELCDPGAGCVASGIADGLPCPGVDCAGNCEAGTCKCPTGGEDAGSAPDAGVAPDAAPQADAAIALDAAPQADAAVALDAAPQADAAPVADTPGPHDAAPPADTTTAHDASTTAHDTKPLADQAGSTPDAGVPGKPEPKDDGCASAGPASTLTWVLALFAAAITLRRLRSRA